MYDVFISYSTKDGTALAQAIANCLKDDFLLDVFLAEAEAVTGKTVSDEIRDKLDQSKNILVLFTPEATKSDWVQGEVIYATEKKKELILCQRVDVKRNELPIQMLGKSFIQFENQNDLIDSLRLREWGIPVIIPAAGKSSGIYPFNLGMPKILLPVGEKPLLHHIIHKLDPGIFSKVIIITGFFSEMVEYYAELLKSEIPITCIRSEADTLPSALKKISIKTTVMMHFCDILLEGNVDWEGFLSHHKSNRKQHGVIGTLMASRKYKLLVGRLTTDDSIPQLIGDFVEKPSDFTRDYSINMAVSIFEPEFFDFISEGDGSLYGDTLTNAMSKGKKFCHYGHPETWQHIQTLNDWYSAQYKYFGRERMPSYLTAS